MAKFHIGSSSPKCNEKNEGQIGEERGRRPSDGKEWRKAFEMVSTMFKEPIFSLLHMIINKPYFSWPESMIRILAKRNQKYRCSYHRENGHLIENCKAFK